MKKKIPPSTLIALSGIGIAGAVAYMATRKISESIGDASDAAQPITDTLRAAESAGEAVYDAGSRTGEAVYDTGSRFVDAVTDPVGSIRAGWAYWLGQE